MSERIAPPFLDWPRIPYVGVGCIVEHEGRLLLVRDRRGLWSTPGGHLDFGESPADCAVRETLEETGVHVTGVEFVAVTNDVLQDVGKHYLTIWMRGDVAQSALHIGDTAEILEARWCAPDSLPEALHTFFLNLIQGRCMPSAPDSLPATLAVAREVVRARAQRSSSA